MFMTDISSLTVCLDALTQLRANKFKFSNNVFILSYELYFFPQPVKQKLILSTSREREREREVNKITNGF